jgi:protein SCO1/2
MRSATSTRLFTPTRLRYIALTSLAVLLLFAGSPVLPAAAAEDKAEAKSEDYADGEDVGIDENLGEIIPMDMVFNDENGKPVKLSDLITRPTVLTLVYFRCAGICSPLMKELAHTVDEVELVPGVDYDLLTVSFDDQDTPEMAGNRKAALYREMEKKLSPESWHFLTGEGENIRALSNAVGFNFKRDKQDFLHAGTVIFLSPEGKIVRYLPGLEMLPFDMKMAVNDARDGKARSLMQKLQRICYSYDPDGRKYFFNFNKMILWVTLGGLGLFLAFLLFKRKKDPTSAKSTKSVADSAMGGGHS